MGWNYKSEQAGWWLLFLFPVLPMIMSVFIVFVHNHPVLFWVLVVIIFIAGLIVACTRTAKKDDET